MESNKNNLEELLQILHKTQSSIIGNLNLLKRKINDVSDQNAEEKRKKMRSKQNKMKSDKEKQQRFTERTQVTVKMLTNSKCDLSHLEKEGKKIQADELDISCDLTPRFHLDTLQFLVDNQFFDQDAMDTANELLIKMRNKQKLVEEKN